MVQYMVIDDFKPSITGSPLPQLKVTSHNEICRRAQEKLSDNFKVLLIQKPIPDLIVILKDGNVVAVEYESGNDLEEKIPTYEGSPYDYVIIVNAIREIILKKEGKTHINLPDLKDFFEPILSIFQIKPKLYIKGLYIHKYPTQPKITLHNLNC